MGAIRDKTNSFNIPFIIGGMSFIISALMHFYLMWINHKEKTQLKKTNKINQAETNPVASDV
jgi:hypothetical protein